jgi:hypothetical protein
VDGLQMSLSGPQQGEVPPSTTINQAPVTSSWSLSHPGDPMQPFCWVSPQHLPPLSLSLSLTHTHTHTPLQDNEGAETPIAQQQGDQGWPLQPGS